MMPNQTWRNHFCGLLLLMGFAFINVGGEASGASASAAAASPRSPLEREASAIIVVGAAGTGEYGQRFAEQAKIWQEACAAGGIHASVIGLDGLATDDGAPKPAPEAEPDADLLQAELKAVPAEARAPLWLVLIGHGTFDGREARFNLRGPDVTPAQLAGWLAPFKREIVVVHSGSASGAFLKPLTGSNRTVVTATKSGDEVFYARFGEHFAPAIAGRAEADMDRDQQVSVLEAFLHASRMVAEFYEQEGRIATEHALLEDNGDGVGTRAEVFEGTRATDAKADGARARQLCLVLSAEEALLTDAQREKRDELERKLEDLKNERAKIGDDSYYSRLEVLLRELAAVYQRDT